MVGQGRKPKPEGLLLHEAASPTQPNPPYTLHTTLHFLRSALAHRLSGSHAGQLFSSGFLWDMPPYVVYRVFYLYEFILMSDKRESGEEGGKKRDRKAVAEDPGKRIRLKREPKEEPKEAKDPEVKVEDEEMASSSALPAHAPAPAPAPAPLPPGTTCATRPHPSLPCGRLRP